MFKDNCIYFQGGFMSIKERIRTWFLQWLDEDQAFTNGIRIIIKDEVADILEQSVLVLEDSQTLMITLNADADLEEFVDGLRQLKLKDTRIVVTTSVKEVAVVN